MKTKHLNRNKQQLKTGWGKAAKTDKGKKHIDNSKNKKGKFTITE